MEFKISENKIRYAKFTKEDFRLDILEKYNGEIPIQTNYIYKEDMMKLMGLNKDNPSHWKYFYNLYEEAILL
jgi:hypothetical protein